MAKHTTLRIGGLADFFALVKNASDLDRCLAFARERGLKVLPFGGGSNTLFSSKGFRGLVLRLANEGIDFSNGKVCVGAGESWPAVARACAGKGLDCAPMAGIPGTVGAAVFGNAGAHGVCVGDFLQSAEIVDLQTGKILRKKAEWFQFAPRFSVLQRRRHFMVWRVWLGNFPENAPVKIAEKITQLARERRAKQPVGFSAGSFFKNPPGKFAGALLESCGLKGLKIGGAQISPQHANFFLNIGGATFEDFRQLATIAQEKVLAKFQIKLEREVQFLGD